MWGHYANAGMGVVLKVSLQSSEDFHHVNYEEENRYNHIIEILTNKSKEWSYEKEVRFIKKTNNRFFKEKIEKIYFGMPYENLSNYEEIKSKHRNLKKYLRCSDLLKNKCSDLHIPYENYQFI